MSASFFKLSGAGNDFIALPEPEERPSAKEIRDWCRRGISLGADGVFTLQRRDDSVRMVYFNADGSRGELCLNGCRCASRLAFHLGWANHELDLATDIGHLRARDLEGNRVALELPPMVGEPVNASPEIEGMRHAGWYLEVGVPHFVMPWPLNLATAPVSELGSKLRHHPDFSKGANVDFVRFTSKSHCEIRTYERGVEAETLACGTGVVATIAAGIAAGQLTAPATALTAGGYEITVSRDGKTWAIEGDARIVASGEIYRSAGSLPPAPQWSAG